MNPVKLYNCGFIIVSGQCVGLSLPCRVEVLIANILVQTRKRAQRKYRHPLNNTQAYVHENTN